MDRKELREDYIDLGRKVVVGLDKSDFRVIAAFWFLLPDAGWRFVMASPVVDQYELSKAYEALQKEVSSILGNSDAFLNMISIVSPTHPLIRLLKTAIKTGPDANSAIRFSNNVVNGQFIEDAYIYRMS